MNGQPGLASFAQTFADFAGRHRGEAVIVCGCGASLNTLPSRPDCVTIGVNDVGRRFDPDYLVVVNPPAQFPPDRRAAVTESRARAVFTQYADWRLRHAPRVPIALGSYGGVDVSNPNVLHYTRNSPYVAVCLAIHFGAARVGLIGIDFTNDHFFGATGVHNLAGSLNEIDAEYARLRDACAACGVEIVNLSQISRLTSLEHASLDAFLKSSGAPTEARKALRVVSYSVTPVAGVPAILARCIAARTEAHARCVWATNDYGNGVAFEGDLEWARHPERRKPRSSGRM